MPVLMKSAILSSIYHYLEFVFCKTQCSYNQFQDGTYRIQILALLQMQYDSYFKFSFNFNEANLILQNYQ
jgi:hypothetical protein